ncbi:hypothetical protein F4814DRAFT_443800 [Daldinia grandis]|nr:hypothetical protein F4814DRAFT_443800 [Daldinia grandis]
MVYKTRSIIAAVVGAQIVFFVDDIPPAGHDTPLCSATSEAPNTLNVRNIKYALRNPPLIGRLQLDVTNRATNATTHCDIAVLQLTPGQFGSGSSDELWTSCDEDDEPLAGSKRYYTISTDVLFDRKSTRLAVNQTWYCDDATPEYPITFKGTVETQLTNLTCDTNSSDQYLEECIAPGIILSIYQYWRDDLPPDAPENPIPSGTPKPLQFCLFWVFYSPAWHGRILAKVIC